MKTANPLRPIVVIKEGQENKNSEFKMALAAWNNSSHLLRVTIVTVVVMATCIYCGVFRSKALYNHPSAIILRHHHCFDCCY